MRRPFDIRVQSDDDEIARAIAAALTPMLAARGTRARVSTGRRAIPGTNVAIGVRSEDEGSRWLAPLDVPTDPAAATATVAGFLEEWGFMTARKRAEA